MRLDTAQAIKQNETGTAYAMLRRRRDGRAKVEDMPIIDTKGKLLTNSNDCLIRWRKYFDLLDVPSSIDPSFILNISNPPITTQEEERHNKPPTLLEVEQAIGRMKWDKMPGIERVTADVFKADGRVLAESLHLLFLDVWKNEEEIEDRSTAILIRLFKNKGDKMDCGNYRGVSLLSIASKVFSRVVLNRVQTYLSSQLLEVQSGFQANRPTIDHIFTLTMLLDHTRDCNKFLCLCFIDVQKVCDSVNRDLLWAIRKHYGRAEKIVHLLQLV